MFIFVFNETEAVRLLTRIYLNLPNRSGKAKDADALWMTWDKMKKERRIDDFSVSILKLSHFFKALNRCPPEDFAAVLKDLKK